MLHQISMRALQFFSSISHLNIAPSACQPGCVTGLDLIYCTTQEGAANPISIHSKEDITDRGANMVQLLVHFGTFYASEGNSIAWSLLLQGKDFHVIQKAAKTGFKDLNQAESESKTFTGQHVSLSDKA